MNLRDLGCETAKHDYIIQKNLEILLDKENKLIEQVKKYKDCHHESDNKSEFQKLLEKQKLFMEYKLQTKTQQIESLYKLLEYFNTLEDKKQQFDTEIVLKGINKLEKILNNYKFH